MGSFPETYIDPYIATRNCVRTQKDKWVKYMKQGRPRHVVSTHQNLSFLLAVKD